MKLSLIINQVKSRGTSLATRVAGAAEFKALPEAASLAVPCAFVIPLDDNPQENIGQNVVRQFMRDSFAVIVAVSNTADEKGQAGFDAIDAMRAELWSALLGWQPTDGITDSRYNGIEYEGGSLLSIDRARMWWQFEFGADMEILDVDGYQAIELAALPHFQGVNINMDGINPENDPNRNLPMQPDGRIEHAASAPAKGANLPT